MPDYLFDPNLLKPVALIFGGFLALWAGGEILAALYVIGKRHVRQWLARAYVQQEIAQIEARRKVKVLPWR